MKNPMTNSNSLQPAQRNLLWRVLLVIYLLLFAWEISEWVRGAPETYRYEHLRRLSLPLALVALAWGQLVANAVLRGLLAGLSVCSSLSYWWLEGDWIVSLIVAAVAAGVAGLVWVMKKNSKGDAG